MMTKPLEKEYEHYLRIREALAREHDGKLVAIKGHEVLGIFEDYMDAANVVYAEHERGTVLMQEISTDPESLAVFIHTPGIVTRQ